MSHTLSLFDTLGQVLAPPAAAPRKRPKFRNTLTGGQCARIYDRMAAGYRVNIKWITANVSNAGARRIKDLIDIYGVAVQKEEKKTANSYYTEYFL